MACESGGTVEIYVEPVLPAPRLVLMGSTPAAEALARIGEAMGYRVERAAHVPMTGAYVVVATMGEEDLELLQAALASEAAYIGVVASRKRFEHLRETLSACGVPHAALDRVRAPAGLDIGARTPEEIALSVMAEIVKQRRAHVSAEPAAAKDYLSLSRRPGVASPSGLANVAERASEARAVPQSAAAS